MNRADSLRQLEQEVGVLVRRVKRVIGVRARLVHEEMQPSSYLMLAYLAEHGPTRSSAMAEIFAIDKGAISRQVQHLVDLGLVDRSQDPEDGRASLLSASDDARRRLADVAEHRRKWLDEQLGDWSAAELADFVEELGRYNQALSQSE
ncbi:MarR family transcriptional regulator [Nocardioides psychrotolerans]|uniref:DNA-binding transcriptional regulator, MarR family n=1 Tax=Nocardioides psychrotolerans TaxID=1005945 RepID=A0A1I3Q224_9ACTN|nr:MarR family transcriptional regulator [Nocardioides psychrotolerans]GEP40648.1 MarR family transcriptional regulator [Nocardioides psychrotolerans]SFJ27913.1 DNA-binding transcriptional regulator, MarR family [Nocardioides psychrotolerans]